MRTWCPENVAVLAALGLYSHPPANETLNQKNLDISTTTQSIFLKVFFLYITPSILYTVQIFREIGDVVGAQRCMQWRGHFDAENGPMIHLREP